MFIARIPFLPVKEYNHHCRSSDTWICLFYSSKIFPFHNIDYISLIELSELSFSSIKRLFCSRNLANWILDSLPCYEIMAHPRCKNLWSLFFVLSLLCSFDLLFWLHCFLCYTSLTGSYTEVNPNLVRRLFGTLTTLR